LSSVALAINVIQAANCELGRTNDYLAEAQRVLEAEKQQREVLLERQV